MRLTFLRKKKFKTHLSLRSQGLFVGSFSVYFSFLLKSTYKFVSLSHYIFFFHQNKTRHFFIKFLWLCIRKCLSTTDPVERNRPCLTCLPSQISPQSNTYGSILKQAKSIQPGLSFMVHSTQSDCTRSLNECISKSFKCKLAPEIHVDTDYRFTCETFSHNYDFFF